MKLDVINNYAKLLTSEKTLKSFKANPKQMSKQWSKIPLDWQYQVADVMLKKQVRLKKI
jgi:hypothetical protein